MVEPVAWQCALCNKGHHQQQARLQAHAFQLGQTDNRSTPAHLQVVLGQEHEQGLAAQAVHRGRLHVRLHKKNTVMGSR